MRRGVPQGPEPRHRYTTRGDAERSERLAERPHAGEVGSRAERADLLEAYDRLVQRVVPESDLFGAAVVLGFPRLPIRPAVSVIAGREAWERFTTNGTEEDIAAARIAIAARLAEKAQPAAPQPASAGDALPALPCGEKAQRVRRCAFCEASLLGRRRHARHCSARCRAAASDARRGRGHRGNRRQSAPESRGGRPR
jgi:hypothetical protein